MENKRDELQRNMGGKKEKKDCTIVENVAVLNEVFVSGQWNLHVPKK